MKALVGTFNQEKVLVGAFSVIVKTDCETDGSFSALIYKHICHDLAGETPQEQEQLVRDDQRALHALHRCLVQPRRALPEVEVGDAERGHGVGGVAGGLQGEAAVLS